MTASVAMVRLATETFMGQQRVEHELARHLSSRTRPGMAIRQLTVGGLRSSADLRVPRRVLGRSASVDALVGRVAYRRHDLVHRLDGRLPPGRGEVLTIHDLAFLHFDDEGQVAAHLRDQARRARCVVTVSEFSAQELRAEWGLHDVRVVTNGCDDDARHAVPLSPGELTALGVDRPYFMASGGDTTRKNLPLLARAWSGFVQAGSDFLLVLSGPDTARRRAHFDGVPGVVHVGFVERSVQLALMAGAHAVVVPSTYEGFGLPVVEAMAMGVPVLATNRSALPEVAGGAALLRPPEEDAWSAALSDLASDDQLRARLVSAGRARAQDFSWADAADRLATLYRELL